MSYLTVSERKKGFNMAKTDLCKISTQDLLAETEKRRGALEAIETLRTFDEAEVVTEDTPDSYYTMQLGLKYDRETNTWDESEVVILLGTSSRDSRLAKSIEKDTDGLILHELCGNSGPWDDNRYLRYYSVVKKDSKASIGEALRHIKEFCPNIKSTHVRTVTETFE